MVSRRSYCSKSCRDLGIDTVHILQSCPKMGKSELSSGPALFIELRRKTPAFSHGDISRSYGRVGRIRTDTPVEIV